MTSRRPKKKKPELFETHHEKKGGENLFPSMCEYGSYYEVVNQKKPISQKMAKPLPLKVNEKECQVKFN